MSKLSIGDRVTRLGKPTGVRGTVLDVRQESFITSAYAERMGGELPLLVEVKWDNGTRSIFGEEGLEKFEKK